MTTASKNIITLLIIVALALGFGMWRLHANNQVKLQELAASHAEALAAKHDEMQKALAAQADQHQKAIQTLNEDYDKKLAEFQQSQRQQLASAYKEFESIFEGNKKTIDYINVLEGKIKGGQNLNKAEVERLAVIATGLGYLQKQYQKPLEEFNELAAYFEKQAALQPEKPKGSFFRRIFSKQYRESEKEFYREEGMKQAYEQAQSRFSQVYSGAQKQMAAVHLDADEHLKKLYAVIEDKQRANQEDLSAFFDQARKALRTHQDVLKFEPENLPPPLPLRPQP